MFFELTHHLGEEVNHDLPNPIAVLVVSLKESLQHFGLAQLVDEVIHVTYL